MTTRWSGEMQDYELDAYLGEFADQLSEQQRAVLASALNILEDRWPGPDYTDERTEAGNAATEVVFGDATADQIASEYRTARSAERVARLRLTGAILATSLAGETSEPALAERFGVTRMTIRKALGK
jgi:hypothetical protein